VSERVRLEFFPDGSEACPLLCIRDFSAQEVAALRNAALELADGVSAFVRLEDRVTLASDTRLHMRVGKRNEGLRQAPQAFELVLTPLEWSQVEGLLEPFLEERPHGSQRLDEHGEIALLISRDGSW